MKEPMLLDIIPHYSGKSSYIINKFIKEVKSNRDFFDQFNNKRLTKDKSYIIFLNNKESNKYLVLDNSGKFTEINKNYFYPIKENN